MIPHKTAKTGDGLYLGFREALSGTGKTYRRYLLLTTDITIYHMIMAAKQLAPNRKQGRQPARKIYLARLLAQE